MKQFTRKTLALHIAFITGSAAFSMQSALAADQAPVLEEVTITARRQAESLQDVPVSATVFSGEDLQKGGIEDIADYFLLTPNVAVNETGTRGENTISMRGISNIGNGGNSSFALYVDELNVIPMISNPALHDVERIEVLRGPQGTFFGRNAAGGAINLSTVKPTDTLEGRVGFEAASFDTLQGNVTVNVPVSEKFMLRGTLSHYETDGWIKNVNAAGGSNDQRNVSGRIAARYLASPALTIDTSVTMADEHSGLESGVPTGKLSVGSIGLWGLNAIEQLPFFPRNTDRINNDNPKSTDYSYEIFNNRIQYEMGDYTITSVSGYADGSRDQNGDVDATAFDAVNLTRKADLSFLSQEFRLAYSGSGPLQWTTGIAYLEQEFDVDLQVILGSFNPLGAPGGTLIRGLQSTGETRNLSLFGEVDYALNDKLTLTYGGRYSDDEVMQGEDVVNGTPAGPVAQNFAPVTRDFDNYSSKLALHYEVSEDLSTYVMASQGYRTGGVQLDPVLARSEFDPETLWSYEAGAKGSLLDGRLRYAAAVYHIDWQDLQVRTTVNGIDPRTGAFVITTGVENAAEASSDGLELELQAYVSADILVGTGIGYMDASYDSYRNAVVDGATQLVNLSGERLLDAPELTFSAFIEKSFVVAGWDAYARAEYSYVDDKVTSHLVYVPPTLFPVPFDFSFPFHVPSFDVVNLRAGIERGNLSVSAYVNNATDENYYTGTFDDLFASGVHVRTHPREVGARVSFAF